MFFFNLVNPSGFAKNPIPATKIPSNISKTSWRAMAKQPSFPGGGEIDRGGWRDENPEDFLGWFFCHCIFVYIFIYCNNMFIYLYTYSICKVIYQ